jgi:acetoacetyl-CoA synthetase
VGELVCTAPMPSMPLYLWGDDGQRYCDSYFDMYPRATASGATATGSACRITPAGGRHHLRPQRRHHQPPRHPRMGTAELYRAVEALPEVLDSLVVDLEYLGRESWMPLFVVLREGLRSTPRCESAAARRDPQALSARHVPDDIFQVAAVPRTLSGKKMELPVKKLLLGSRVPGLVRGLCGPATGRNGLILADVARQPALRLTSTMPTATPIRASTS